MEKYGLIGEKLPHTLSPQIHALLGLKSYDAIELKEDELSSFIQRKEYNGFNVTIPYKEKIIPFLTKICGAANVIGAVNTVVLTERGYVGYNTDTDGMQFALQKAGITLFQKNVLILGTGGTSKTAEYVAKTSGALSVKKAGRNSEINYNNVYENVDVNVIINTTPVGMFPHMDETPIQTEKFPALESVFDCIYNPKTTLLVKQARERSLCAANGLYMLIEQARKAEEHFLHTSLPPALTEYVAEKLQF